MTIAHRCGDVDSDDAASGGQARSWDGEHQAIVHGVLAAQDVFSTDSAVGARWA
ncbi:MAG: hypothetical protein K2Q25_09355 [Mycobacteriaceae bacterium]|nr:hypothetical protein [Mycobacteriaceae bacterium]